MKNLIKELQFFKEKLYNGIFRDRVGCFDKAIECVEKYEEYKQLEEQGLLLRKPCNVGDHIWVNGVFGCNDAEEFRVIQVEYNSTLEPKRNQFSIKASLLPPLVSVIQFYDYEIGKKVFFSKEEALNHSVS